MDTRFGNTTTSEEIVSTFSSQIRSRTIAITGTTQGGLGAQAALSLAAASPGHLILISRNASTTEPVIAQIREISPSTLVTFVSCSLDDHKSVRAAANVILTDPSIPKIDILLNNAGIMAVREYTLSTHGIEMTLAANHVGHFLLTNLLLPKLLAAGPGARIVNHSSLGHKISPFRFEDYNFSGGAAYDGWSAYGQSKTANILFTVELARRLAGRGVTAFSCHPGSIYGTGLLGHLEGEDFAAHCMQTARRNVGREFDTGATREGSVKDLTQGAATILVAALDPGLQGSSGAWLSDCRVWPAVDPHGEGPFGQWEGNAFREPVYSYAVDREGARKLWKISEELVEEKFEF